MSRLWILGGLLAACAETYAPAFTSFTMRLGVDSSLTLPALVRVMDSSIQALPGEVSRCVTVNVELPVDVHVWREGVHYEALIPWPDIVVTAQRQTVVWHKVSGPCSQIAAKNAAISVEVAP